MSLFTSKKAAPPCYRCESSEPLVDRIGLCRPCELEIRAKNAVEPIVRFCAKCGHMFYNDWERVQHEVGRRHNYRAWTTEQGQEAAAKMTERKAES